MIHRNDLSESIVVRSHGVSVRIISNSADAFDAIVPALSQDLPFGEFSKDALTPHDHEFAYFWNPSSLDAVYKNGEKIAVRRRRNEAIKLLCSQIRITIAEEAPDHVFIHAGVVAVNGKAVVLPAKSLSGKSTLTKALVKKGAVYFSDEYAVIDAKGRICPFPKDISIRPAGSFIQADTSVSKMSGKIGKRPINASLIMITEFAAGASWEPKSITPGEAFLELIPHTIPIRFSPEMAMERLKMVVAGAKAFKTRRGEAEVAAEMIIDLLKTA